MIKKKQNEEDMPKVHIIHGSCDWRPCKCHAKLQNSKSVLELNSVEGSVHRNRNKKSLDRGAYLQSEFLWCPLLLFNWNYRQFFDWIQSNWGGQFITSLSQANEPTNQAYFLQKVCICIVTFQKKAFLNKFFLT